MAEDVVYLDHAASTPVDPTVRAAMQACLDRGGYANPSSTHPAGRRAAAMVEQAQARLAALLGVPADRLVWTSGATEAVNLAVRGGAAARAHRGRHLVTVRTEHKAGIDAFRALEADGYDVSWLTPGAGGLLDPQAFEAALRDDTQLASVMHVNNETGAIQDIAAIGAACRARGILFHSDCAQSVGKLDLDTGELPVDLLSMSAHKFHGPQGIGALYVADGPGCKVKPILHGGGQQSGIRPGTIPVHLAVGMGAAAEVARECLDAAQGRMAELRDRLWRGIGGLDGLLLNTPLDRSSPAVLNVSACGVDGESLMLAMEPVCVAGGSACNATTGEPSFVLKALGLSDLDAQSAVRFSLSRTTTEADIDVAAERFRNAVLRLRAMAPAA